MLKTQEKTNQQLSKLNFRYRLQDRRVSEMGLGRWGKQQKKSEKMQPYPLLIIVNAKLYEFLFPKWVQSKTKLLPFHFIPFFLLVLFDEKKKCKTKKRSITTVTSTTFFQQPWLMLFWPNFISLSPFHTLSSLLMCKRLSFILWKEYHLSGDEVGLLLLIINFSFSNHHTRFFKGRQ